MCNNCNQKLKGFIFKCPLTGLYLTSFQGLVNNINHSGIIRIQDLRDAFTFLIYGLYFKPLVISHMAHTIEFFTLNNVVYNSSLVKEVVRYRKWILNNQNQTKYIEITKEDYLLARKQYIESYNNNGKL